MKLTKEKILFFGILLFLVLMACTIHQWLPAILNFVNPNTALIQGLASLIQISLWFGVFIISLGRLYFGGKINLLKSRRSEQNQTKRLGEQPPYSNTEQSTSYSVNANTIQSLTQGNDNQTIINFNDSTRTNKHE
ncbi:MAG: hypothetical protein AAGF93_09235 [Cyanobacteria bacterium P01_H01_bin.105]